MLVKLNSNSLKNPKEKHYAAICYKTDLHEMVLYVHLCLTLLFGNIDSTYIFHLKTQSDYHLLDKTKITIKTRIGHICISILKPLFVLLDSKFLCHQVTIQDFAWSLSEMKKADLFRKSSWNSQCQSHRTMASQRQKSTNKCIRSFRDTTTDSVHFLSSAIRTLVGHKSFWQVSSWSIYGFPFLYRKF